MMTRWSAIGVVVLALTLAAQAGAEEATQGSWEGILTSPTFTGTRDDLEAKGITFDASLTQITQGVVAGGKDGSWEYGGRGDLTATVDTQKLGLWPGGFLSVEVEGNWDEAVNAKTGAYSPANVNQLFPVPGGGHLNLPNVSAAQFLSHYFGVMAGKIQTLNGADENEFAYGKGDTRFLNLAFNTNQVALVVPYSTLGAGAIILPTADPHQATVNALVLSATGDASTTGFDDLNGAIFAGQGRVRTDFFGRTGHQLLGGLYSNREYTSLDQRLAFVIENARLEETDNTWAVYYNFDQYLYETDKDKGHGVGVFARFGASEGNPNPARYFLGVGVGGKGMFARRPLDRFGIGYYYVDIRNPTIDRRFRGSTSFLRDEHGFEVFYNLALTPWLMLTPDLQVIRPAQKERIVTLTRREDVDTAVILGFRLQLLL